MAYTRQYTNRVNWQNSPSLATPLNATNLNKMDAGLSNVDSAVASEFASVEQDISDLQRIVGDAVTDVTLGGTSVVDENGVAAIPAIPSVPVQDVQVDDVSIVDGNGVAKLDSSNFGTPVEANPTGTASADLTKLKVGNDIYNIPSGGGGTTVVANPSGTATDDLEKIQIGSTIYDIPSGGGASVYMSDYYSTEERVVGRWIDGKPLYQKTFDLGSNVTIGGNSWYESSISATDVDKVIHTFAGLNTRVSSSDAYNNSWDCLGCTQEGGVFKILNTQNGQITMRYVTIQYTKTTDAPGTGPTAGNIIYLPALYSEEEREVGVWTDGKPLYQKTWVFANQVSIGQSWSDIPITKADYNFEHIVSAISSDAVGTNNKIMVSVDDVSKTVIRGYACHNSSLSIKNLTLQYTKTTDTPGSGTWTPDGQLSHHYMTSEHIVGTWIDGSTLYEITFTTPALTSNSWNENNLPVANIDKIVGHEILLDELQDSIPYTFTLGSADGGRYEAQFWHNRSANKYQMYVKAQGTVSDIYATITIRYTKSNS